ncbi:MAG: MFS transporter [Caldilineaceae bacterium]
MNLVPALHSPAFRRFWIAQLISTFGTALQVVAESWLIYHVTGSVFWLGMVGFLSLLPVLPVSMFGGLLIDRLPRRKVILVTQSCLLLQATLFGLLATFGVLQLWHLLLLYFVFGAILAIDHPARRAFLVELVPNDDLVNAVALNAMLFNFSTFIGYAAAGVLIATVGAGLAMLLNAATYLAPILVLLSLQVGNDAADRLPAQTSVAPVASGMNDGLRLLWQQPTLLAVIGVMAVVGGATNPVFALMPAYAPQVLQSDARGLGVLLAAGALGSLLGTLITGQLGPERQQRLLFPTALLLAALVILFSYVQSFWGACLLLVLLGAALLLLQSLAITKVQVAIPDRVRGRVMTIYSIVHAGSDSGGAMVVGWLALYVTLPVAIRVAAVLAAIGIILLRYVSSFATHGYTATTTGVDKSNQPQPQ